MRDVQESIETLQWQWQNAGRYNTEKEGWGLEYMAFLLFQCYHLL